MEEQLLHWLHKVRADDSEATRVELNELLRKSPEARTTMARTLVDEQALLVCLRDESLLSILDAEADGATKQTPKSSLVRHLSRLQQLAVALLAGAIVGLMGVGVVWAVSTPKSQARELDVANGDFEAFVGRLETGFPSRFGKWGGNPAQVTGNLDGNRELCFLETGNVKGDPGDLASNCSVFQFVDLSSIREQWGTTNSETQVTLNLSARFRRESAQGDTVLPKLMGSCRIYLFNLKPDTIGERWPGVIREDGVGFGKNVIKLWGGEEPATITASCLLGSEATVALVVVSVSNGSRAAPVKLGDCFVDDVQLTAIRQPTLPFAFVE